MLEPTSVPSHLATPDRPGPILRRRGARVEGSRGRPGAMTFLRSPGKGCTFTFYDGARHGFAVRTHPGYAEDAAKQSFDEAKRFLDHRKLRGRY